MFAVCPETKRCAGMEDKAETPEEDSRGLGLVHFVEVGGKNISFLLLL